MTAQQCTSFVLLLQQRPTALTKAFEHFEKQISSSVTGCAKQPMCRPFLHSCTCRHPNKIASGCRAPRPPMTDVGTETAFRLDQRKHFRKSKHLLRSEVSWCDLHLRRSTWLYYSEKIDQHTERHGFCPKRNHFRGQSSSRPLFGHPGCWSIAKCSQRRSCRNFTGGFRSWLPATCSLSTRRSFDHRGKGNGNFV